MRVMNSRRATKDRSPNRITEPISPVARAALNTAIAIGVDAPHLEPARLRAAQARLVGGADLVLLPFRVLAMVVHGLLAFVHALVLLPARLLGGRP